MEDNVLVRDTKTYFEKLAWFLDRSSVFLRNKQLNQIVVLKGLNPDKFSVYVQNTVGGDEYYTHIDNVEPILK